MNEKDFIKKGMQQYVESYWSIYKDTAHLTEASKYIVDTYFECIDSVDFETWVTKGNEDGKPYIADEYNFERFFKKIFNIPLSKTKKVHLINELYFNGNLSWEYMDLGTNYFYTTQFKDEFLDNVDNFNYQGCLMEAERLLTLIEIFEEITDKDLYSSIEVINQYLNYYFEPSDYNGSKPMKFLEDLNNLIGGIL